MAYVERVYRLLIVDDDETDRHHYVRLLTQHAPGACEIEQAADGIAGLAALCANRFDCVLLDYDLPDMSGLKFLVESSVEGEPPSAVVLITGHGNEAIAVEAMKHGAQDYLVKGQLDASRLWRAVSQATNEKELHQRLARSLRDLTAANSALEVQIETRVATEVELRAAKEAAEHASQVKTRFVAMVTHELRTPLNGILGYAQLLRMEGGLTTDQDGRVGAILQAGRHLLDMIERVLDFAAIETGRMELRPVPLSVRELADGCVSFIGPIAADHGLNLRLISARCAPKQISADPVRLRQVLLNLLGNAVKFTAAGSVELRLLAGRTAGGLRVEVADSGVGISAEGSGRLFQDFERLEPAASVEGTGLGLAISARIIALMGGSIGQTAAPGGGSIFWIELPPGETAAQAPLQVQADAKPVSGLRVLLVDDIEMNRDVIGAFLCAAGHEAVLAEGGKEAVRLAFEQNFDLILMDVRMPEMDGLEATRQIRQLPRRRGVVPILALTANSFPEQIAQCREAGMDGHVAKPVDYASLVEVIAATVTRTTADWAEDFVLPTVPAQAVEPAPPRFDRATLDQALEFMWPEQIAPNLRLLRARKEKMVQLLDQRAAPALLADHAHGLASAAGMFGFPALTAVGRRFEHALAHDLPETEFLTVQLRGETCAALTVLDQLLREDQIQQA